MTRNDHVRVMEDILDALDIDHSSITPEQQERLRKVVLRTLDASAGRARAHCDECEWHR
jgi:hypothetical protein